MGECLCVCYSVQLWIAGTEIIQRKILKQWVWGSGEACCLRLTRELSERTVAECPAGVCSERLLAGAAEVSNDSVLWIEKDGLGPGEILSSYEHFCCFQNSRQVAQGTQYLLLFFKPCAHTYTIIKRKLQSLWIFTLFSPEIKIPVLLPSNSSVKYLP